MELERASRARESADILLNGGSLPARVESIRTESPQTPSSPLKSMTSAPQPGESLEEASQREASLLAEEVRRLRSQLQSSTEKWSRDKQMFAEVLKITHLSFLLPRCTDLQKPASGKPRFRCRCRRLSLFTLSTFSCSHIGLQ